MKQAHAKPPHRVLWIVVVGGVVDGFVHYGPFEDPGEASDWASRVLKHEDYWIVSLAKPETADG